MTKRSPYLGLPPDVREPILALRARRAGAPESEIDEIEAEIVGRTYWYALRPDEIARATIAYWRLRAPL